MAKEPVAGRVKTRLAAEIGNQAALVVYDNLLHISRTAARSAAQQVDGQYGWWVAGDNGLEWACTFDPDADAHVAQQGDDLGQRMTLAFEQGFARDWSPVIMIGCDIPDLDAAYIVNAAEQLAAHDVVIGPANDGGYVLIGLRSMTAAPMNGPDWGTAKVLDQTVAILAKHNLSYTFLSHRSDLDLVTDLDEFPELQIARKRD